MGAAETWDRELQQAIREGEEQAGVQAARALLSAGRSAGSVVETMSGAMALVGEAFQRNEVFLPDIIVAADAFDKVMAELAPLLRLEGARFASRGRVVLGVVQGDVHDIGKNIVSIMLGAAGFEVTDLGSDVAPSDFVDAARNADIVAMSALMSTTMGMMRQVIEELEAGGLRHRVKVLVGGAPISADFARSIGADGYGADAVEGVKLARAWMEAAGQ